MSRYQYGESEFTIQYYDGGIWKTIAPDYAVYSSKYQFNIDNSINLKTILGEKVKIHKGVHHKFVITFQIDITSTLYNNLMTAQTSPVRFLPHKDFDKYYNCIITLVKPFYLKNNLFCDAITVNIETSDYQPLEFVLPVHNIIEAIHLGDNTTGLNGGNFVPSGTVTSVTGGKFGNCIQCASGENGLAYLYNYEASFEDYLTMTVWCKLPDAGTGDFIYIGSPTFAGSPYLTMYKHASNGDGTTDISSYSGGKLTGTVTVNEGEWFMITVLLNPVGVVTYINDQILSNGSIIPIDEIYYAIILGTGSYGVSTKDFAVCFDEFILSDRPSENYLSDNQDYWYNNGLGRQFKTVRYYAPMTPTTNNLFYIAHNPSQSITETNNLFYTGDV
jgi:hypothetical protein